MNNKRILSVCILLVITLLLQFIPVAYADETNSSSEESTEIAEADIQEEQEEQKEVDEQEENKNETTPTTEAKADNNQNENNPTTTQNQTEEHKVAVITTKVDENGNPLKGAVLQILDSNGNVVDEWTSNGEEHTSLLPEGDYTLHEKEAPEGYILGENKAFTVKVEINEINAGVDHSQGGEICDHVLGGIPLYYVESKGERLEVYCINQGWKEPDNTNYDGTVLTEENIRMFAPDADPDMTDLELYNKVLDIIYRRSKAQEVFPDLTEVEIRFITEVAIKNYTSALVKEGGGLYQYRDYRYDESVREHFVVDEGNGDGIGQLAKHWWTRHNKKTLPEKYAELFYYLINGELSHPSDMHLYVYSTKETPANDENYQNLLGVIWYNPYDEDHTVRLTMKNEKAPKKTPKKVKKSSIIANPQTGDNIISYIITLTLSMGSLAGVSSYRRKEF